jgi:hypothetical protein
LNIYIYIYILRLYTYKKKISPLLDFRLPVSKSTSLDDDGAGKGVDRPIDSGMSRLTLMEGPVVCLMSRFETAELQVLLCQSAQ